MQPVVVTASLLLLQLYLKKFTHSIDPWGPLVFHQESQCRHSSLTCVPLTLLPGVFLDLLYIYFPGFLYALLPAPPTLPSLGLCEFLYGMS